MAQIRSYFFALLFLPGILLAQKDSTRTQIELKAGLFHNSYMHYYGRSDSIESSGLFPVVELWADGKFYLTVVPVFIYSRGTTAEYAGTVAMAGYRFGKVNRNSWHLYAVKPLYRKNVHLVQSAMTAQIAGTHTWLNKTLNVTLGSDLKISRTLDVGAQAGVDKPIHIKAGNAAVFVIDPSFYIYAGTRHFSNTYYKQSTFLLFPGPGEEITEKVTRFDILSWEGSVPLVFVKGKMQVLVSPSFVAPQNLSGENGRNRFYVLAGIKYTF